MVKKRRTNQGGSVVTFVLVGIILVGTLIGGIYLVTMRGQQARKNQEIATSQPQKTSSPQNNTSTNLQNSSNSDSETNKNGLRENSASSGSGNANLPQTGIEFNFGQFLGLYLLTMTSVAYVLSKRKLKLLSLT